MGEMQEFSRSVSHGRAGGRLPPLRTTSNFTASWLINRNKCPCLVGELQAFAARASAAAEPADAGIQMLRSPQHDKQEIAAAEPANTGIQMLSRSLRSPQHDKQEIAADRAGTGKCRLATHTP